jgi:hypothetical protein
MLNLSVAVSYRVFDLRDTVKSTDALPFDKVEHKGTVQLQTA